MSFGLALGFPRSGAYLLEWAIRAMFASGQQGAWYEPSDLTTLYQDSAGTTPVTAVEQPVGLMLDKRLGLVLGPELVTNGDFATDTWWAKNAGVSISGGQCSFSSAGQNTGVYKNSILTVGKWYQVTYTIASRSSGSVQVWTTGVSRNAAGTYTEYYQATTANFGILAGANGTTLTLDNISVRELPGNHAYHTPGSTLARPVLRALYNMLAGTATLSTQSVTTAATTNKLRFEGTGTLTLSGTATGTYSAGTHNIVCTAGTLTLTVSGTVTRADLRAANEPAGLPEYQAVSADRLTYDTVGFPVYLRTDGVDDGMQTNSIDFSASDKMFVAAGVRKLSDANRSAILAIGLDGGPPGVNSEYGLLLAPDANSASTYWWRLGGSLTPGAATVSGYAAPNAAVLSARADIAANLQSLRVNAAAVAMGTGNMGTGNLGTGIKLYLFRRGGTTLPFNGRFYGSIIRGGTLPSAAEINNAERYLSGKMGGGFV